MKLRTKFSTNDKVIAIDIIGNRWDIIEDNLLPIRSINIRIDKYENYNTVVETYTIGNHTKNFIVDNVFNNIQEAVEQCINLNKVKLNNINYD